MSNNALSASLQRLRESSLVPIIQDKPGYNRPTSIADAISRGEKTMLSVQKERGLQPLVGWVKGRLIELFTYLGAFDIASEYQIQVLATRICTKFYYWTIQELDFAFLAFADGRYGKLVHYNHERDVSVINPQDVMKSLIEYEKELMAERGRVEDEKKKQKEAEQAAKDAKKPHGLEAWKLYCESNGLDPATHKLAAVKLHDVNEELYDTPEKRAFAERKFTPLRKKQ